MTRPDHSNRSNELDRRDLLKAAAAVAVTGALPELRDAAAGPNGAHANLITRENQQPGTDAWQLSFMRPTGDGGYRTKLVEGYCSRTSVRPGETVELFLSADPATQVTLDVYRMGYYGGKGGRFVTRLGPFDVTPQPDPPVGQNRLR